MAAKRTRTHSAPTVTPTMDTVKTPTEQIPNQYDSILQRLQELEAQNKVLTKKVAEANNDISEQVKESKRRYGYEMDGSRKVDELFKYGYRVVMNDRVEKVVIKTETVGRPVNYRNENTGKWTNQHTVEVTFHDGTKTEMDVLDYINQSVKTDDFVRDEDIKVIDGKRFYTFHTDKFGTFTIAENFIN
jgi:hypothetical protein